MALGTTLQQIDWKDKLGNWLCRRGIHSWIVIGSRSRVRPDGIDETTTRQKCSRCLKTRDEVHDGWDQDQGL